MNKASLQAFSAGIIFSTAIMAGFYYGNHVNKKVTFTTSEAKKMLEAQGYSISKAITHTKSEQPKTDTEPKAVTKNNIETNENNKESEKKEEVISYILKIKSKMTTSEITELLEKEKIIDDATKFQDYMNKEKLSRQVQIGEYIVSSDMNYKELGELITK